MKKLEIVIENSSRLTPYCESSPADWTCPDKQFGARLIILVSKALYWNS
jgi:hypothetical protein